MVRGMRKCLRIYSLFIEKGRTIQILVYIYIYIYCLIENNLHYPRVLYRMCKFDMCSWRCLMFIMVWMCSSFG